jgi:hypothetical protein
VVSSHYGDTNLQLDLISGQAVTGIQHFVNETLVDWYSKCQATVETAASGSEVVAARIPTNQLIDHCNTFWYLGVPIVGCSHLFGDCAYVVISVSIPHSSLKKQHNALSFHCIYKVISAKILYYHKMECKKNPSDNTGYQDAWPVLKPLLFLKGKCLQICSSLYYRQMGVTSNNKV